MANANIMDGHPQAQLGYALQPPNTLNYTATACGGTEGCKRFVEVDNKGAEKLTAFVTAANTDMPKLKQAANNSGHHYLEGEQLSQTALNDVVRLATDGIGLAERK
jgi:hypothetical protein